MSSPVIDVAAILAPIPGGRPGDPRENASASAPYYRVKDARNAARAEERATENLHAGTPDAWGTVVEVGVDLLSTKAKDLEVAGWLAEALIRTDGFAGLRDGLTAIAVLIEHHWDDLYPAPDEDGMETKVSPVAGLGGSSATGTLDRPIRNTPLTRGATGAFSFWNYEQALELEKIKDPGRRAGRLEAGAITLETFRRSVAETPVGEIRGTLDALAACAGALARISAALDRVAGEAAPSVSPLQELLAEVAGCLRHVAGERLAALPLPDRTAGEADGPVRVGSGIAGATSPQRPSDFANRDEALAQLTQIASYFRRTEPHSPISYTIDDAVRRARMTLQELLFELADDPGHVQHMLVAAGIKVWSQDAE